MKVNSTNNRDISFNGFYNSNGLKKILKFAADNSCLFAGTTSFTLATVIRTPAILATPKTDKKNKEYASAKSLSSAAINFLITLLIALPFAKSIQKIDSNPAKYLKEKTIKNLQENKKNLENSKAYTLATELFKLGLGIIIAAPKAILNGLSVPLVMDKVFPEKQKEKNNTTGLNFKGKENLTKGIAKILDKKYIQDFAIKFQESNFPMHIMAITDTITTATFIGQIKHSKKIEEERKNPLSWNAAISTASCIASGYLFDKALDKPVKIFTKKFIEANKDDIKLEKYLKGIKIAKPIVLFAGIYYIIVPLISTFLADRLANRDKISQKSLSLTSSP